MSNAIPDDIFAELSDHLYELTDTDTEQLVHFGADLATTDDGAFEVTLADGRRYRLTATLVEDVPVG